MTDDDIVDAAREAFNNKAPDEFLRYLRGFRAPGDSPRVQQALDRLETEARNRLEES